MTEELLIDGKKYNIRLLSAFEKLQAASASAGLSSYLEESGLEDNGISFSAVLAAMSLELSGEKAFNDGYTALNSLSAEQLEKFMQSYDNLAKSSAGVSVSEQSSIVYDTVGYKSNVLKNSDFEDGGFESFSALSPTAEKISEILESETIRRFRSFGEG